MCHTKEASTEEIAITVATHDLEVVDDLGIDKLNAEYSSSLLTFSALTDAIIGSEGLISTVVKCVTD